MVDIVDTCIESIRSRMMTWFLKVFFKFISLFLNFFESISMYMFQSKVSWFFYQKNSWLKIEFLIEFLDFLFIITCVLNFQIKKNDLTLNIYISKPFL